MSKITRAIMKVFGETGGTTEFAQIGSKAAGSAVTTKDLTTIQALTQYLQGQAAIVSDQGTSKLPYLEDRNALDYLFSSQLSYLMQAGIPEWLNSSDQRYYANASIAQVSGSIYLAIKGDDSTNLNVQKAPASNPEWWTLIYQAQSTSFWDTAEASAYDVAGVVVDRHGTHYASSGKTGNSAKDPDNPQNDDYWLPSPGWDKLKELASKGESIPGGMHPHSDYSSGDYQQSLKLDEITRGGVTYDVYKVQLDGTVVTGDATLEAIFNPGGAKQYPWIDKFAPDNLGTRTLIDQRGRGTASMTSGGGEFPTLGEVKDDQFQGWQLGASEDASGARDYWGRTATRDQQSTTGTVANNTFSIYETTAQGDSKMLKAKNDGTNGDIRQGKTTHGALLVRGVDYIIVIIAQ